jgi:rhamnosyl/mannosyltransferase
MRVGGATEIVEEGVTGFLAAPDRPQELGEGIARLVADAELRASMGAAARAAYEARFTARLMVERFVDLYRRAIEAHAAAAEPQAALEAAG